MFPQIDTIISGVCSQVCLNYPKQQICYFFAILSWFSACRLASKLGTNWYYVLMGMVKHSQSLQNSEFEMSLQYLE